MDLSSYEAKQSNIQAINKDAVHQICSGQVVLNLATAVKELVENSLDANSTVIEVRLREYGSELIEVVDNGIGVQEENFEGLTLKHHTSKLREFSDLVSVETFGFRGEALSSLCALSEMAVITRNSAVSCGTRLEFDHQGQIIKKKPCARQVGTTVILKNIFSTLPVRHKEFHRNLRREFVKMTQLLYAYCLVSIGTKITCINQNKKGGRTIVVSTQGSETVRDNIACVFGSKQLQNLMDFEQKSPNETVLEEYGMQVEMISSEVPFQLEGYISTCSHGQGRSAADRQFFYVNSRPCEPAKMVKVVNEVYHQFNQHQYPFVFLNLKMDRSSVDVNVTPDKRQVFLDQEKLLMVVIKASLLQMYQTVPSTFNFQNLPPTPVTPVPPFPQATTTASLAEKFKQWNHSIAADSTTSEKGIKRISEFGSKEKNKKSKLHSIDTFFSPVRKKDNSYSAKKVPLEHVLPREDTTFTSNSTDDDKEIQSSDVGDIEIINDVIPSSSHDKISRFKINFIEEVNMDSEESSNVDSNIISEVTSEKKSDFMTVEEYSKILSTNEFNSISKDSGEDNQNLCTENIEASYIESDQDVPLVCGTDMKTENDDNLMIAHVENKDNETTCVTYVNERLPENETSYDNIKLVVIKTDDKKVEEVRRKFVQMTVSFDDIKRKIENRKKRNAERNQNELVVKFRAEIDPSKNKSAEQELCKEISKDMFSKMEILGQFNLGFIVTRLGPDLFIIDQHATDEKYNFEMLQRNTIIQNQRLVLPQKLELTAVNESILIESEEVFRKNGFDFIIDEQAEPTKRIQLTAVPISKNWHFGKEDIDELLFMLQDSPNTMCRPSRVRAMFASRACRKSIMIGTALSKSDMRRLVNQMGEIEQPWNCPHGRPTMRHLVNLGLLNTT